MMTVTIQEAMDCLLASEEYRLPYDVFEVLVEAEDDQLNDRLMAVVQDPRLRRYAAGSHAVEVLAARGCVAAAGVIARTVAEWSELDPDHVDIDCWHAALLELGADATEAVLAVVEEVGPTGYLEEALEHWDVKDERIYRALVALGEYLPEQAAAVLAGYGDARALPLIHRWFAEIEVTDDPLENAPILEFSAAIERLGGELTAEEQAKIDQSRAVWKGIPDRLDALLAGHRPAPHVAPGAPGRNDPCWCGSGKKYKKCHLKADQGD